ncbi:Protein of unknown function [Pyronema omphalodes CBS 100304]|uniref:Uncharacterized protein n=1 Tax=Pyronema omphalodes (strain CBS 100304) TaxID=1076935 RepID=U4L4B7_PYROM|nr:Protein of unknown function [Pyronema omphalodes CBS 100304]
MHMRSCHSGGRIVSSYAHCERVSRVSRVKVLHSQPFQLPTNAKRATRYLRNLTKTDNVQQGATRYDSIRKCLMHPPPTLTFALKPPLQL